MGQKVPVPKCPKKAGMTGEMMWYDLKRKIRWELLFFDSLIYLLSALLILVIYPSSVYTMTKLQTCVYAIAGWICIIGIRMVFHLYRKIWRYAGFADYIMLMVADGIATIIFIIAREFFPKSITAMRVLSLFMINLLGCIVIRMVYQWIYQGRARDSKLEKALLWLLRHLTGTTFADEKKNLNKIKMPKLLLT